MLTHKTLANDLSPITPNCQDSAAALVHQLCALAGGIACLSAGMALALETRAKAWKAWNAAEDALEAALALVKESKPPVPKTLVIAEGDSLRWLASSRLIPEMTPEGKPFHWAPVAAWRWALKHVHPNFIDNAQAHRCLALALDYEDQLQVNRQRFGIDALRMASTIAMDRLAEAENQLLNLPATSQADKAAKLAFHLAAALASGDLASLPNIDTALSFEAKTIE